MRRRGLFSCRDSAPDYHLLPPITTRYHLLPPICVAICAIVRSARCADATSTRTRHHERGPRICRGLRASPLTPWRTASCHNEIPVAAISATSSGSASRRWACRATYAACPSTTRCQRGTRSRTSLTRSCPCRRAATRRRSPTAYRRTDAATSGGATEAWRPSSPSAPRFARASARGRLRLPSARPREPSHGASRGA